MTRRSSLLFTGLIALAMLLPDNDAAAQNKPVLTFPTNGYNLVSPSANTFSWYYITTNLNVSYTFEVYLNPGCTGTPVVSEIIAGPSAFKNNVSGLLGGLTYYWRVRAGGTPPSAWSDVFEFKTTGNPPLNIFAKAGNNGSISPSGTVFPASGSSQTFLITPNTGSYIKDVLIDNVSAGALSYYTFRNITASHSITALFAQKTFTMTASASSHGTVSPAGTTSAAYNSTLTYRFTPSPGYRVTGLVVDGVQTAPASSYTFSNITSDHTIEVTFGQGYIISTSVTGGGSVNPSADYFAAAPGSNQTFTFTPFSGFRISEVKVDGTPIQAAASDSLGLATAYTFTNLAADHSLNVAFTNEFPVTVVTGAHGKTDPSGITNAPAGSVVKIYITPDKGYGISSITVNGTQVPLVNPLVITADRPYNINVTFFQSKNYYVAVNGNDSNPGTKELPMKTIYWAIQRAAEGDSVIIENGYYNELFSSKPFVKVRGSGSTMVEFFQVSCDNIYLSNINFVHYIPFGIAGGISNDPNSPGYTNINLDHITINAPNNYGLSLTNCKNINITNSDFSNSGNFSAIRLKGCTDVTLTDVNASGSRRGIVVEPSNASSTRNISFTRVKADKNGIDSAGTAYTALPGILLRGVYNGSFRDIKAAKNGTGISILGCSNLTFENLTVDSSAYDGIQVTVLDTNGIYPYVSSINLSFNGLNRLRMNNGNAFRFDTYGGIYFSVIRDINFSGRTEISQYTDSIHTVSRIGGITVPYFNNGHAAVLLSGGVYNACLIGLDLYTAGSNREPAIVIGDISDSMRVSGTRINNSFFRYESGISLAGPRGTALNNVDARNNVYLFPSADTQGISTLMTDRTQTQNPNMGIINYNPYTTGNEPGISLKLGPGGPGIFIGGTYSFDVKLNPRTASFYFIKCTLTWDPSKLEYKGYISNGLINDARWNLRITENSAGSLTFEGLGTTPISSIGKLFTLQMKVVNQQSGIDSLTATVNEYFGLNTTVGLGGSTLAFFANFPPGPVQDKGDVSLDRVVNQWDYYLLLYHISGLYPL
ncbi:MAG: right-handed parallel beta-helix repeat-containing protein, partial [Syntrophothermus sp.]